MRQYDQGDKIRLTGKFRDGSRALADPTAVVVKIKPPHGDTLTYTYLDDVELARDSAGVYHVDVTPAAGQSGVWFIRWEGTGTIVAADEYSIFVKPSHFQ